MVIIILEKCSASIITVEMWVDDSILYEPAASSLNVEMWVLRGGRKIRGSPEAFNIHQSQTTLSAPS
jgi:hypothetical protein